MKVYANHARDNIAFVHHYAVALTFTLEHLNLRLTSSILAEWSL